MGKAELMRPTEKEVKERRATSTSITTNPGLGGLGIAFHQVFSITFPIPQPKGVVSKDKHVKVKKKMCTMVSKGKMNFGND